MSSPGRQSLVHLGALTVLTAGAIALSLATAPPVAEQQLHIGAGATTGVGSFVMDLVNTVTTQAPSPGGSARVQSRTLHIVYQAPDRLHETLSAGPGQTIDIVVIGDQRYQRTAAGRWVQLPPGRTGSVSTGQAAVNGVVLVPATAATAGTPVVRHGKTSSALYAYGLPPAQLATVYRVLFGVTGAVIAQHAFDATIDKEYMVSQTFLAAAGNQTDRITVRYSELGTAPAVTPPPPSALR